jgi:hypothetical protein
LRAALVRKSKEARKTEQARRLAQEADKIAEILNEDFRKISERLHEIRAASSRRGAAQAQFGAQRADQGPEDWVRGIETPGVIVRPTPRKREGPGPEPTPPNPNAVPPHVLAGGRPDPAGDNVVDAIGGSEGKRRRPQGGFKVEYRKLGKTEERSVYDPTALTILINLDHPLVVAALGDGKVEDTTFRRLSYEIAFSEYAMGLGYEVSQQDPNIAADDLLYEVRSTLNRISLAAVTLYR